METLIQKLNESLGGSLQETLEELLRTTIEDSKEASYKVESLSVET